MHRVCGWRFACQLQRLGEDGVDDMIQLDNLDEPTIMKNLELRYKKDIIYVWRYSQPTATEQLACDGLTGTAPTPHPRTGANFRRTSGPFWSRSTRLS